MNNEILLKVIQYSLLGLAFAIPVYEKEQKKKKAQHEKEILAQKEKEKKELERKRKIAEQEKEIKQETEQFLKNRKDNAAKITTRDYPRILNFIIANIKSNLKSPLTAVFCSADELNVIDYQFCFLVYGYVDAQNAFGALLRTRFLIELRVDNDGYMAIYNTSLGDEGIAKREGLIKSKFYVSNFLAPVDQILEETKKIDNMFNSLSKQ